jgi:putative transposase
MDIQEVTAQYRLSKWMQVIQERQSSGQKIKDFCQEKGISISAYFYWQRKLRKAACLQLTKLEEPVNHLSEVSHVPQGWMQLTQSQEMKSTLDIEVGGCHITVNAGTDPELLKNVCRILRVL